MAFKTDNAQSSWLPDQMLKKGAEGIWRSWRKRGLSVFPVQRAPKGSDRTCRKVHASAQISEQITR